jgi:hypothetical protein
MRIGYLIAILSLTLFATHAYTNAQTVPQGYEIDNISPGATRVVKISSTGGFKNFVEDFRAGKPPFTNLNLQHESMIVRFTNPVLEKANVRDSALSWNDATQSLYLNGTGRSDFTTDSKGRLLVLRQLISERVQNAIACQKLREMGLSVQKWHTIESYVRWNSTVCSEIVKELGNTPTDILDSQFDLDNPWTSPKESTPADNVALKFIKGLLVLQNTNQYLVESDTSDKTMSCKVHTKTTKKKYTLYGSTLSSDLKCLEKELNRQGYAYDLKLTDWKQSSASAPAHDKQLNTQTVVE